MDKAKGYHRMSVLEGEYVASIHRMLGNIYGKTVLDVNAVKNWINKISENPREKKILVLVTCLTVEDQLQLQIRIWPYRLMLSLQMTDYHYCKTERLQVNLVPAV